MNNYYSDCQLCPRCCKVDRYRKTGFCQSGTGLKISSIVLHKGEEPPISGRNGSGTVFFSACPLGCSFCQNHQISSHNMGMEVSDPDFVSLLLDLQEKGTHNINFVTGTHFIPGIINGLAAAREAGLTIPAVWNTSGFESDEGLDMLADSMDIFLPDIKTVDRKISQKLLGTELYAEKIIPAVGRMITPAVYDRNGMMIKGTIIRHLVLPGLLENTRQVLEIYSEKFNGEALISLMVQYGVPAGASLSSSLPERMKTRSGGLSQKEYDRLLKWLDLYGIDEGFVQELSENSGWLPDFTRYNPFPEDYSEVIWHWKK